MTAHELRMRLLACNGDAVVRIGDGDSLIEFTARCVHGTPSDGQVTIDITHKDCKAYTFANDWD